jgi:hypothetical protein
LLSHANTCPTAGAGAQRREGKRDLAFLAPLREIFVLGGEQPVMESGVSAVPDDHLEAPAEDLPADVGSLGVEDIAESLGTALPAEPDEPADIGEIDPARWKEHDEILTDSLWIFGSRSREGMHAGKYHGNFVPQIPYQAIRRFTKPGDVVLDPFLGSGTTLIECRRQGRHGIGVELIEPTACEARERIEAEANPHDTWQEVIPGDSTGEETIGEVRQKLEHHGRSQVQLLIMHPPYHDIIHFSDDPRDLCNAPTLDDFRAAFRKVVRGTYDLLERDHFLVVVIGDKYSRKAWVPLGFRAMETVLSVGYQLKSIVVKNMEGNRAKRDLQNFWRRRAFKGNFYIFKHEYVLFFQKVDLSESLEQLSDFVRAIDAREEGNLISDGSLVSGEELGALIATYTWITSSKILALKHGQMKSVVLDMTGITLTQSMQMELEALIRQLINGNAVDVSVVAEGDQRERLLAVRGVSQVYSPDGKALEQLAHTMYVFRKAVGSGQRAGRAAGVNFANALNAALGRLFEQGIDYEYLPRAGIGFKFFQREPDQPFGEVGKTTENFKVGLETTWVAGHENEKLPQIRDRYHNRKFQLVAVVGPNIKKWQRLIEERGNFADFYLFVGRNDERSLENVIQSHHLTEAIGESECRETTMSLVEYLTNKQQG